jgi:putative copper export protein
MLSPTADSIRLFLHVPAASVWVGGQIVLGGLVPKLRQVAPESLKVAANAFARIAWPAFAIVVVTGMWNILDIKVGDMSTEYQVSMFVHVLLAMATAMFVVIHSVGKTKLALALGGALGLLTSLGAMFVGILLQTGS